jgi:hypothetical protein
MTDFCEKATNFKQERANDNQDKYGNTGGADNGYRCNPSISYEAAPTGSKQ